MKIAVGGLRDPVVGLVVMVALSGIWVEVLADVVVGAGNLLCATSRSSSLA